MNQQEQALRKLNLMIAKTIKDELPPGVGFTLLVYNFGPDGLMTYCSNAERSTMIEAMIECLGKLLKPDGNNEEEHKV